MQTCGLRWIIWVRESDFVVGHFIDTVVSLSRNCGFWVTAEGVEIQAHGSTMKKRIGKDATEVRDHRDSSLCTREPSYQSVAF